MVACSGTDARVGNLPPDGSSPDGTVPDARVDANDAAKDSPSDGADARTDGGGDAQSDAGEDAGADAGEDSGGDGGDDDAGAEDGGAADAGEDAEVDAGDTVLLSGIVVDVANRRGVEGAAVAAGPFTVLTDAVGRFALRVPTDTYARPTVTKAGYTLRLYEELAVSANSDQGTIPILSLADQTALRSALPNYNENLGAVAVRVLARGRCPNEGSATLAIAPAGVSRIAYFRNGLPDVNAPNVQAGQETSAIIYNLAVSTPLSLSVERAGCTVARYPTTNNGLIRSGNIQVRAGNSITTAVTFVE